jgi:kumamolisin
MISIYVRRDLHENGMSLQEYADAVIAGTHPILSHDEFAYQFGSLEDELALVNDWAVSNQLTVVESHVGMAVVKVSGTFEQFNALFGITLKFSETDDGHQYQSYDGVVVVPNEINDVVDTVLGFDQEPKFTPHLTPLTDFDPEVHSDADPQVYPNKAGVRPQRVATAYNMPAGDGYGGCVAIIELTYSGYRTGYNTADVTSTFNRVGYPIPTIVDVLVDGATRITTSDAESMLDIYCAAGVVPRAKLVCYTAPNTTQGFLDGILACANDTVNRPSALGISWGGGEFSAYLSSGFQACVAQGITCFSSTGDSGADGYTCLYPSTDPYQIAAGGTSIYLNADNTWNNEAAWSGGGGGPASQGPLVPAIATDLFDDSVSWYNITNIQNNTNNGIYTYTGILAYQQPNTIYVRNFGFSIPTSATINGITVQINKYADKITNLVLESKQSYFKTI